MSRYVIVGSLPGLVDPYVPLAGRVIATLADVLDGLRIDVTATDAPTTQVDLRIGDGVTDANVSLPVGQTHAQLVLSGTQWPQGANLELEVTAGAGAFNLTVQVFVEEAGVPLSPAATGLVTLADAKSALRLTDSDAARDNFLQRAINAVSERIRGYCLQHITQATYRDEWFAPSVVHLRANPVQSITSVTADVNTIDPNTGVRFVKESGRLLRAITTSSLVDWHGTSRLEVIYVAGHATCPVDLAELIYGGLGVRLEGWLGGTRGLGSAMGASRVQFPDGGAVTYQTPGGLEGDVSDAPDYLLGFPLSMLDPYRDVGQAIAPSTSTIWEFYTP